MATARYLLQEWSLAANVIPDDGGPIMLATDTTTMLSDQ